LLEAPTAGYEDAIVVPEIAVDNFELKHGLLNLITSTIEVPERPIRRKSYAFFFPIFPSRGQPGLALKKNPLDRFKHGMIDDLVSKFINKFFPPSKTTNLRNEITRFQQRFDETFYEAWDRFNDLLRACPHHGFSELHQLDTFYNALNSNDQDSLNSAAGGNFLDKMPRDCLRIIESKSKVRNSRNKPVVAKVSSSTSTPGISSEVAELKDMVKALLLDKKNQSPAPTPVKAVRTSCVLLAVVLIPTKLVQPLLAMFIEIIFKNMSLKQPQLTSTKETPVIEPRFQIKFDHPVFLPFKTIMCKIKETIRIVTTKTEGILIKLQLTNPRFIKVKSIDLRGFKGITTRSGVAYKGPTIHTTSSPKVVEREPEVTKDTMHPTNNGSTEDVPPPVVPIVHHESISEPRQMLHLVLQA
ncbi:reverse transcriptase domain-containing protein, partial [Tanacetum coccineum]